jgi:hypothetical protein
MDHLLWDFLSIFTVELGFHLKKGWKMGYRENLG